MQRIGNTSVAARKIWQTAPRNAGRDARATRANHGADAAHVERGALALLFQAGDATAAQRRLAPLHITRITGCDFLAGADMPCP